MVEVYRATDTRLGRTVAIKLLPAHVAGDPAFRARFEREAKAISSLNHSTSVRCTTSGTRTGLTSWSWNTSKERRFRTDWREVRCPLAQALQTGIEIAALEKAHRRNTIRAGRLTTSRETVAYS